MGDMRGEGYAVYLRTIVAAQIDDAEFAVKQPNFSVAARNLWIAHKAKLAGRAASNCAWKATHDAFLFIGGGWRLAHLNH
jgi:hypothetical protein